MREVVLSFIAVLVFTINSSKCSELGKDGFNYYKDYLRSRPDDSLPEEHSAERMLYFYRTPMQSYQGFLPTTEEEYKKRMGNAFKTKTCELIKEEEAVLVSQYKRESKREEGSAAEQFHFAKDLDHMLNKEAWMGEIPHKRNSPLSLILHKKQAIDIANHQSEEDLDSSFLQYS